MGPRPLPLPPAGDSPAWSRWLRDRCGGQLASARQLAERLRSGAPDALATWNDILVAVNNAEDAASLIAVVHPDEELRHQAAKASDEAHEFTSTLMLDRRVYDVLAGVDPGLLDKSGHRVLTLALRDFRRAGVDRDDATRARLVELQARHAQLRQLFERNIDADERVTRVRPEQVESLPEEWRASHPPGGDGLVPIRSKVSETFAFLTYAADPAVRQEVARTWLDKAWPENDEVLAQLLAVRRELAEVLGYSDWSSFEAEERMIGSCSAVRDFIERTAEAADASGRADLELLLARAREDGRDLQEIDESDRLYYLEAVRRDLFRVDAHQVREHLRLDKVRDGLLQTTARLFGLTWTPRPDEPTWHPDVMTYDVDLDGEPLGRIHLDLEARPGKGAEAAQFSLVRGIAGRQLPEGALVCQLPRGLLEHEDVVVLFHEFGHLVHHLMAGRHVWARFSGIATEDDFAEAPSQLLEDWAYEPAVLATFATNESGEVMPTELAEGLRAARDFGIGLFIGRWAFRSALAHFLHVDPPADLARCTRELDERYGLVRLTPGTHFYAGFAHLAFYGSAFYTYPWSWLLARDLLTAFPANDPFDTDVARRYRDTILAPGGSKPAAELVHDFLGRPASGEAFWAWLAR